MKKISGSIVGLYFGSMVVFYLILSSCNSNETTETTDANATTATTATDANASTTSNANVVTDEKSTTFLTKAANSGMAEVQLAKLAQQKATLDAVKNFADKTLPTLKMHLDSAKAIQKRYW